MSAEPLASMMKAAHYRNRSLARQSASAVAARLMMWTMGGRHERRL